MKRTIILIGMLLVFSSLIVFAQPQSVQRTEEFEKLNVFVGKWQSTGKVYRGEGMPAIETKAEPIFEWAMHKTWLMFKSGEGRLQGHGYTTWDDELGKYAFFWFDNLLTKPTAYYGDWLDSQTLVFAGEVHFRGEKSYSKIKWRFVSENEINMVREASTDGKNFRVIVEANYKKGREQ